MIHVSLEEQNQPHTHAYTHLGAHQHTAGEGQATGRNKKQLT